MWGDNHLLTATAKLALATAKQVRTLTSATGKTITIPDATALGQPFAAFARPGRPWTPHSLDYCWAQLILLVLEHTAGLPEEALQILQTHASAHASAESLREHVLQCYTTRTRSGDAANLRLALNPEMRTIGANVGYFSWRWMPDPLWSPAAGPSGASSFQLAELRAAEVKMMEALSPDDLAYLLDC